ncbi:MAG: universal stress protein [Thermoanaerobaculia bacterium]|nr:universal stress protein [Thermoanaerobaculia bacterium]
MLNFRKILFPTDLSPASRAAFDHALLWTELADAELILLHVLSLRTADPFHPDHQFPTPQEYEQRLRALAESELALFVPRDDRPLRIRQLLRSAPEVERGILEVATAEQVDLMVLGTHGRRGASHLLIGSTAAELLRRSEVPVLVVPSRSQRPAGRLRRILAPTDFSPSASVAVTSARELAAETGATLELFHVLPNLEVPLPMNPGSFGAGIVADLEPAARAALAELAARPGPAAKIEIAVWQGPAAASIVNRATETDVDLVVLASHGRSGLDRLLLGSVTEKVARLSSCPVLVLPARAAEAPA